MTAAPLSFEQVIAIKHWHPCNLDTNTMTQCIQQAKHEDALDWGGETLAMAAIFGLTYAVLMPLGRFLRSRAMQERGGGVHAR